MINTLANPNIILARFFYSGKGKGGRAPAALTARVAPAAPKLQGQKNPVSLVVYFGSGVPRAAGDAQGPQRPQLGPFPE